MSIVSIRKLVLTPRDRRLGLESTSPPLAILASSFILLLSLLPPLLLYYAGTHYGDAFSVGLGGKPWATIAIIFFLVEMLTFLGMGWFIVQVAAVHKTQISTRDAYMLAGIAPTPLWLSSLALLVPSLAFNAAVIFIALAASFSLIYRGLYELCDMHEGTTAAGITQTVMGAGMIVWALLLIIVVAL